MRRLALLAGAVRGSDGRPVRRTAAGVGQQCRHGPAPRYGSSHQPVDLYPGGTGALRFTVTNPNPFGVTVRALTMTTITSSEATDCPATYLSVAGRLTLSPPVTVPAGSSRTESVSDAVTMAPSAPSGCEGVSFTVALRVFPRPERNRRPTAVAAPARPKTPYP